MEVFLVSMRVEPEVIKLNFKWNSETAEQACGFRQFFDSFLRCDTCFFLSFKAWKLW